VDPFKEERKFEVRSFFHELATLRGFIFFFEEYLESQCSFESEFLCVDGGSWKDSNFG
jgi:hypothetical protein